MARALPGVASAPLITIGVTCFNAEGTVERAVRSALEQDWPITEIIVVDDMSTDGSWAVLESLQTSYPELRLIRHDRNRGYPGAVNTIIASALGEFVALFDDDDDVPPPPNQINTQKNKIIINIIPLVTACISCSFR